MERKIRHLEMIQAVIGRMGSNSFMMKGWAVALITGLFVLSSNEIHGIFLFAVYIPMLVFWGLDSYYLLQEKRYRRLYENVQVLENDDIDFNMKPPLCENTFLGCFFSVTEIFFYLPLAVVSGIVITFVVL